MSFSEQQVVEQTEARQREIQAEQQSKAVRDNRGEIAALYKSYEFGELLIGVDVQEAAEFDFLLFLRERCSYVKFCV
jgi:hypothetical protein